MPPKQDAVPFGFVHALPQLPQLATLVLRFASQPFAALPSQLPNPRLQMGAQAPAEQTVVPFAFVQAPPHEPQFATLIWVFVSQPFDKVPSQLPNPESHAMAQDPTEQLAVPFTLLQSVPQLPQFATLEFVFTSQPLVDTPSQLANPLVQAVSEHVPEGHEAVAFGRLHVEPHAPQFERVVSVVSQPSAAMPLQSPKPGLHVETPQTPPTQFGVPPAAGQTLPHTPQLLMLVAVFVSQPFRGLPSQSPEPAEHAGTQVPAVHAVVPFEFVQA